MRLLAATSPLLEIRIGHLGYCLGLPVRFWPAQASHRLVFCSYLVLDYGLLGRALPSLTGNRTLLGL